MHRSNKIILWQKKTNFKLTKEEKRYPKMHTVVNRTTKETDINITVQKVQSTNNKKRIN